MKRYSNLYKNIYKLENVNSAFNEVCRNTKNKRRVYKLKEYKCVYISRIIQILKNKSYKPGPCNVFKIYEPKERRIVSQNMQDKIINHLVARHILYPALLPCLLDVNVASRKGLGTAEGLRLAKKFHTVCKTKYKSYYILKCDISKFFASIDHDTLKAKLKIRYYVRYQDDFLLFHPSKTYLKQCLTEIENFLKGEKLQLNRKTRIYKCTNNFIFLGRNKRCKYAKYRDVNRKLKKQKYLYHSGKIQLNSLINSIICYKHLRII